MTNECYISEDIVMGVAMMLLIAGAVIVIPVSFFTVFVPMKRADMRTGLIRYIPYLNGVAFFGMVVAVGSVIDVGLFKNCLSIFTSTIIILGGLIVGVFSGLRYKHLLLNKARVDEYKAKVKEIRKVSDKLSETEIPQTHSASKGLMVYFSMVFVQIAIPAIGCYLLLIGLPWFNRWVSTMLALLIFGGYYAGYFYLKRKSIAAIDRFLEEESPTDTLP